MAATNEFLPPQIPARRLEPPQNSLAANGIRVSGKVGYGTLAINSLGYSDPFLPYVLARHEASGYTTISAHAPSDLRLELNAPTYIHGFLNCSSRLDPYNPVSFWTDYNWVGDAYGPGDRTAEVRLGAGSHTLQASCRGDTNRYRHSIWALKLDAQPELPETVPVRWTDANQRLPAHHDTTAVLTIAAYPTDEVFRKLQTLMRSARRQNIWVDVIGIGEQYVNSYQTKIRRLAKRVHELPPHFRHVLYLDGRDTVFLQPLGHICEQFNIAGSPPLLLSAECGSYPSFPEWAKQFPHHPTNRRWINAGVWMGERSALEKAFCVLQELHDALDKPRLPVWLSDFQPYRRKRNRDQFLWQAAFLKGLAPVTIDHNARLAANLYCSCHSIPDNRDFAFEGCQVIVRATGSRPGILHFSGNSADRFMEQWCGFLGIV